MLNIIKFYSLNNFLLLLVVVALALPSDTGYFSFHLRPPPNFLGQRCAADTEQTDRIKSLQRLKYTFLFFSISLKAPYNEEKVLGSGFLILF